MVASLVALLVTGCSKDDQVVAPATGSEANARLAVSKTQFYEKAARKLAKSLSNAQLRSFIKTEAVKKFDGDYDVLFSTVKGYALSNELTGVDLNSEELAASAELPLLNVAVPVHAEEWDPQAYTPLVAFLPEDYDENTATQITAFDANGQVHLLDAKKAPAEPVIVISHNERTEVQQGKVVLKSGLVSVVAGSAKGGRTATPGVTVCGLMPHDKVLYLSGFWSGNLQAIEDWTLGAPEIRMNMYYADQSSTGRHIVYGDNRGNLWEPPKRDNVNNRWWRFYDRLVRWTADFGDIVNFAIWEEDSGDIIKIPITVKGKFLGMEVNANVNLDIKNRDDYVGVFPVDRNFCTNSDMYAFGNQTMKFTLDYGDY